MAAFAHLEFLKHLDGAKVAHALDFISERGAARGHAPLHLPGADWADESVREPAQRPLRESALANPRAHEIDFDVIHPVEFVTQATLVKTNQAALLRTSGNDAQRVITER